MCWERCCGDCCISVDTRRPVATRNFGHSGKQAFTFPLAQEN